MATKVVNNQVIEMTDEENNAFETYRNNKRFSVAMEELRAKRNKDLQDSDWTQLPDNTLTSEQRNAWMQFRTELRNITDGITTVEQVKNVDYPDKPNG